MQDSRAKATLMAVAKVLLLSLVLYIVVVGGGFLWAVFTPRNVPPAKLFSDHVLTPVPSSVQFIGSQCRWMLQSTFIWIHFRSSSNDMCQILASKPFREVTDLQTKEEIGEGKRRVTPISKSFVDWLTETRTPVTDLRFYEYSTGYWWEVIWVNKTYTEAHFMGNGNR